MSAHMVSEEQINVMIWAAIRYGDFNSFHFPATYGVRQISDQDSRNRLGQELLNTNAQALEDLYGDDTSAPKYTYHMPRHHTWEPIEIIKIVHNYEYQACDNHGWHDSDARSFCQALVKRLLHHVPGFEQAHWGIDADTEPTTIY